MIVVTNKRVYDLYSVTTFKSIHFTELFKNQIFIKKNVDFCINRAFHSTSAFIEPKDIRILGGKFKMFLLFILPCVFADNLTLQHVSIVSGVNYSGYYLIIVYVAF